MVHGATHGAWCMVQRMVHGATHGATHGAWCNAWCMVQHMVHGATHGAWCNTWCMAQRMVHGATHGARQVHASASACMGTTPNRWEHAWHRQRPCEECANRMLGSTQSPRCGIPTPHATPRAGTHSEPHAMPHAALHAAPHAMRRA
eukprot:365045-Chlamydomonas_euryale.AAC.5